MQEKRSGNFEIKKVVVNSVNTIVATGKCDIWSAQLLKDSLAEVISGGYKKLIIDARNLRCVDNSGLAAILWARHKIEESEGKLVVVGLKNIYGRAISVTDNLLDTASSISDALIFLSEGNLSYR